MSAYSQFPESTDSFTIYSDIQESDKPYIIRLYALQFKDNLTTDEQTELDQIKLRLKDKTPTANWANLVSDALSKIEVFINQNIQQFFQTKQTEATNEINASVQDINSIMNNFAFAGMYDENKTYQRWNLVSYNEEIYQVIQQCKGQTPNTYSNDAYYFKLIPKSTVQWEVFNL